PPGTPDPSLKTTLPPAGVTPEPPQPAADSDRQTIKAREERIGDPSPEKSNSPPGDKCLQPCRYATCAFLRRPRTLCANSRSCTRLPDASNGISCAGPVASRCECAFTSLRSAGDTHSSASSSVFGTSATRSRSKFGCQHVSTPH